MITVNKANPTAAEERTSLVNASDGQGLNFDGSAGYIDIASPPDLGTKASFELVISAATASQTAYIFDFGSGGRTIFGLNSGSLRFYSGGWSDFSVSTLDDLKVHHLCVTVDGTAAVLYDNGNQVATATLTSNLDTESAADLKIGSHHGGSADFFNGTIYRARFYNRTLSADDVRTAYERSDVPFADQYGSQTELITSSSNRDFASGTGDWGANGITLVNDSGLLKVAQTAAYNPSNDLAAFSNGRTFLQKAKFSTPPNGKRYRLTLSAKAATSGSKLYFNFQSGSTTDISLNQVVTLTDSLATYSFEILPTHGTEPDYILLGLDTAEAYWIDNVSLVRVGVVSDYDLAYANENQSRMVADRSTNNVDGEMSSSGVKQTQVIKQLNSTAMRVGGTSATAATPADGELLVSTRIGVNVNPSDPLHIDGDGDADILLTRTTANTDGTLGRIFFGGNDHDKYLASVEAYHDGAVDSAALKFTTEQAGTSDRPARLTINSLGHVLVGGVTLDANVGVKKMQLEGSASTAVGPEMLLHNPAQGGGAASLLTFGGKASGTEGYTAAIKATNTGTLTIGTSSASGGFSEPAADLTIDSSGNVAIGQLPTANFGKLQVYATGDQTSEGTAAFTIGDNATGGMRIYGGVNNTNNYAYIGAVESGTAYRDLRLQPNGGNVNLQQLSASSDVQTDGSKNLITSSDKRLKNDIGELTAGLDIISNLQPHYFSWKSDQTNTQQLGFYAQDVYEFLPEAAPREEVTNEDGTTDYKWGFNGRPIIAALVAAVKELKAKVETLENA